MSKPALIKEADVARIARACVKAGCVAEIKIGDVVIRLSPPDKANEKLNSEPDELIIL